MSSFFKWLDAGERHDAPRLMEPVLKAMAVGLALYLSWYALFGAAAPHFQVAVVLAVMFPVVFLTTSSCKGTTSTSIVDYIWAGVGLTCGILYAVNDSYYENWIMGLTPFRTYDLVLGLITVGVSVEACRRSMGWGLTAIFVATLAYVALGGMFTGPLSHGGVSLQYFIDMQTMGTNGVFGAPVHIVAKYAFMFLVFGVMFSKVGGGEFFFNLSNLLTRRLTVGEVKSCVVASGLYGSVSGSPVADVVTTGPMTISIMKSRGHSSIMAAAIEAAASSGGAVLPPVMGAAAFVLADFIGYSYGRVITYSIIPGLLFYFGIMLSVHLYGKVWLSERSGRSGTHAQEVVPNVAADPKTGRELLKAFWTIVPFIGLFWLIVAGYTPQYVATAMTCILIVASWIFGGPDARIGPARFVAVIWEAVNNMAPLIVAVIAAGAMISSFDLTGLTGKASILIGMLGGGSVVISLMVVTVVLIILGMGMPTVSVYLIGVALVAPVLIGQFNLEVFPVHLFILYYASMSAITPPLAVACFAASAVAGVNAGLRVGLIAVKIAIAGFTLPWFFIFHEGILGYSGISAGAYDILNFMVFIYSISVMLWGHFGWQPANYLERSLMGCAAVLVAMPTLVYSAFGFAIVILAMLVGNVRSRVIRRARVRGAL